jgi:predicted small metal-binding protein
MGEKQDGVVLVVSCACGVVMRGPEDELVPMVQKHARESHNMNPTREDVLSRARPES